MVFLLLLLSTSSLFAQKRIILEKVRCLSAIGPVMSYWKSPEIRKSFASQLNRTLLQKQQLPLTDTSEFTIEWLPAGLEVPTLKPDFTDTDSSHLHLYMDLFEISPASFFSYAENYPTDSAMQKRAKSVFLAEAWVVAKDKSFFFHERLNAVISSSESPGMGILFGKLLRFQDMALTPKGFTEMLKAAANLLFDPGNELVTVEMKVSPAYVADNYILPKTINQPRTYVSTNKNISTFNYRGKGEMIRMGDAVYEEIKIKGKKAEKYPDELTKAIKNTVNYSGSDYVFLRQECRDVMRNKNYLLTLSTQVNPDDAVDAYGKNLFLNFLSGDFHYLFLEKDTLAKFVVEKHIRDGNNKIYEGIVSNGYDSTSFFNIRYNNVKSPVAWDVVYDYIVTGKINQRDFQVKCSGLGNTIKEIFLGGKLVCMADGKFNPEKFVVFDASLSPELLNQLFIIGFNRFFE